jgi:hypothetical protein
MTFEISQADKKRKRKRMKTPEASGTPLNKQRSTF